MVEINVKVKEGYYSSSNAKTFVILNTELTQELILEGIARPISLSATIYHIYLEPKKDIRWLIL